MILACPFCKAKGVPGSSRCGSCGMTVSRTCPACAETIAANATMCKYCGEAVGAAPEPAPPKPHPGIIFVEEAPRRRCCVGRSVFWLMVAVLAGVCAYSAIRTRVHLPAAPPAKHAVGVPSQEF